MTTRAQLAELDAVIAELKTHPEKHDQKHWILFEGEQPPTITPALDCGSAFCIAGAVVARAGGILVEWRRFEILDQEYRVIGSRWVVDVVRTSEGTVWTVGGYARELLGLSVEMANRLFDSWNSMDDIERIRDEIAATVEHDWPDDDLR